MTINELHTLLGTMLAASPDAGECHVRVETGDGLVPLTPEMVQETMVGLTIDLTA